MTPAGEPAEAAAANRSQEEAKHATIQPAAEPAGTGEEPRRDQRLRQLLREKRRGRERRKDRGSPSFKAVSREQLAHFLAKDLDVPPVGAYRPKYTAMEKYGTRLPRVVGHRHSSPTGNTRRR